MSLVFYMPTRVYAGAECVITHADAFKALGKRALVVTGKRSAVASGAAKDLAQALAAQGIASFTYDKIPPNPGITEIREAAQMARDNQVDFIVGIGGGSPLDAAKAIAILAVNDLADDALYQPPFPKPPLPIAAIPTTAGTGSEVTPYAILTNHAIQSKSNISHESIFPKVAFLDARYTYALPRNVTVNTALDALSHLVEGFLAVRATSLSRSLALQGLALLGPALRSLASNSLQPDPKIRETLLLASTSAGMVIAHTGTTLVHAMGYSLTYFKDIDHGRANALTMAAYLKFLQGSQAALVQQVLVALGYTTLDEMRQLLDTLLGQREKLSAAEIAQFSARALKTRNVANTLVPLTEADIAGIFSASFPSK